MHESGFGRVIGVLVSPDKTFRSIAERPTWAVPLLLLVALGLGVGFALQGRVDQSAMVKHNLDKFGIEVSEAQMEEMQSDLENQSAGSHAVGLAFGTLLAAGGYFLLAVVFLVAFRLAGSTADFDFFRSLAVTVHGLLPGGVAALLNVPLILARSEVSPEEVMRGGVLTSSLRPLAPEESPVLESLLGSLDFFTVWSVVLLILGFRAVARVSTQTAATIVLILWGLWVLGKAGFAAVLN